MGVLLFNILTGQAPFRGTSNEDLMDKHVNQPVPNILDLQPDLPAAWQEILNKAMAKSPADRYQSAGGLAQDIQGLLSGRWYWRNL
jgi:serine/threonine-protein kinase